MIAQDYRFVRFFTSGDKDSVQGREERRQDVDHHHGLPSEKPSIEGVKEEEIENWVE